MVVAPLGEFGLVQQTGNTALAVLWLVTGVAGFRAARERRYADHRAWMLRSVALTWSIVANRVWVIVLTTGVTTLPDGTPDPLQLAQAVGVSTWASWVVNLLVVEWWVLRQRSRGGAPARRA